MDTLFWRGSSDAVEDRRKMGQSQRGVEDGGFEDGQGFSLIFRTLLSTFRQTKSEA